MVKSDRLCTLGLIAMTACLVASSDTHAGSKIEVSYGYMDSTPELEVVYTAPTGGASFGMLEMASPYLTTLNFDLTPLGGSTEMYEDVRVSHMASIGQAILQGDGSYRASASGLLSFVDASTNFMLLRTTYSGALTIAPSTTSGLASTASLIGLSFGSVMIGGDLRNDLFSLGFPFLQGFDGEFTLFDLEDVSVEPTGTGNYFTSFSANSNLSARSDAAVPSPGTGFLVAAAGPLGLRRRRTAVG